MKECSKIGGDGVEESKFNQSGTIGFGRELIHPVPVRKAYLSNKESYYSVTYMLCREQSSELIKKVGELDAKIGVL